MARQVASGRTTATNRLAIQDGKSSLSFNGTSMYMTSPVVPDVTGFSFGMWVKTEINLSGSTEHYVSINSAGFTDGFGLQRVTTGANVLKLRVYSGATSLLDISSGPLLRGGWSHIVCSYVPSGICKIYTNGVLSNSGTATGTMGIASGQSMTFFKRSYTGVFTKGSMKDFVFHNTTTPWTQAQITALYQSGTIPTGATAIYKLDEGAGTTAYDTSGNANHGTITNGTYVLDTPTKKRKEVNGNLVYNGDFSYVPPFVAATNTQYKEIDGTASGQALPTGMLFGWSLSSVTGGGSAMYDNGAMKVSITATGSSAYVRILGNLNFRKNLIKSLPNTSYTASVRIKTNYVSGDATTGARLEIKGLSSTYSDTATYVVNDYIKTTTDWTEYTITFTTGSSIIYLDPTLVVNGSGGTGTLIMDAWFDNIELRPTTPTTRGTA